MSIRDIQAIFMIAFAMFMGMGLYSLVATFIVTRKRFILWSMRKGMEVAKDMESELEKVLE